MMYVSPPSIHPTHTGAFLRRRSDHCFSRSWRDKDQSSPYPGPLRTRSRGLRRRCSSSLCPSIHFASLRPLESTLSCFSIRSQLPIIYCTYFAAYSQPYSATTATIVIATSTVALIPNPPTPTLRSPPIFLVFD
jgi:hypothetical protein